MPANPTYHDLAPTTLYSAARVDGRIQTGDKLFFRGELTHIAVYGRSPFVHVGRAVWFPAVRGCNHSTGTLMIAESREKTGGRLVTLSSQVRRYPGLIDVYRPVCWGGITQLATEFAVRQAGHEYNWAGIARLLAFRFPGMPWLLRALYDELDTTLTPWESPKFCSQQEAWCDRKAAQVFKSDWDPCPGLADWAIEPGDLARSGNYRPICRGLTFDEKVAA